MRFPWQSSHRLTRSPAPALAWEIFRSQRSAFAGLAGTLVLCAILYRALPGKTAREVLLNVCIVLMGLSLAATFLLFRFTESDRRQRLNGFPRRLFTFPVRTIWLVTLPMTYGSAAVVLCFAAWTALILRPANPGHFDLGFPSLYLATGMVCFQAIVWSLASFPIVRLIVLGVWGTALATSWISFSPLMGQAQIGTTLAEAFHLPLRSMQVALLVTVALVGYTLACWSVHCQRRGARSKLPALRLKFLSAMLSAAPRQPFASPRAAQFWFEWRRNGAILPLLVSALLVVIMLPFVVLVPFFGRAKDETALITLGWLVVLPFLLGLVIGPGFGKTNFWGQPLAKELGLPVFLAIRPFTAADWLAVKLKSAAFSAVITWVLLAVTIPLWLLTCCNCGWILSVVLTLPPGLGAGALIPPLILLALAMLVTWRLLTVNLCLGVLGSKPLFNAGFCWLFVSLFGLMMLASWHSQHAKETASLVPLLPWLAALLGGAALLKLGLAIHFFCCARRRGLITAEAGLKYFATWIWGTEFLLLIALILPASGMIALILALLAFLTLPLARMAMAPLAFARSRYQ